MTVYGYVRVSTKDQSVARQIDALERFPVDGRNIYVDHFTGASFNRPQYRAMLRRMRAHDVLVIKSIDRLGRNYTEILEQWRLITHRRMIDIVVLDMPLLDTRVNDRDLTGTFIADVVLQLLSYISQVERENTRQRQAEGIAAAKARGVRFGRPRKQRPSDWDEIKRDIERGSLSKRGAAARIGVCRNTLVEWLKEDGKDEWCA